MAHALYYVCLAMIGWIGCLSLYWIYRNHKALPKFFRENLLGFLAAPVLSMFCWISLPPTLRTQWDETAILSSSQTLHFFRSYMFALEAVPRKGIIEVIYWSVDKRPPLFAVLVSLFHDVYGVLERNAFRVNSVVLFLFLCLIFYWARRKFGVLGGLIAQFLFLSAPTVLLCATSGGIDLLAGFLFFATLFSMMSWVRKPEGLRLIWFLSLGCLYAYVRQESLILFFFMLAAGFLIIRLRKEKLDQGSWIALSFLPGILVPLFFLLVYAKNPEFYENRSHPLLSLGYMVPHLRSFFKIFFDLDVRVWLMGVLNLFGLLTLVSLGIFFGKKGRSTFQTSYLTHSGFLPAIVLSLGFLIPLVWFYGDVSITFAWRLFITTLVVLAIAPVLWLDFFSSNLFKYAFLVTSVAIFLFQIQRTAQRVVLIKGKHDLARDSLETLLPKIQETAPMSIFVSNIPMYFVAHGLGALEPQSLIHLWPILEEERNKGQIQHIFLLRLPNNEDEEKVTATFRDLENRFKLSPYAHNNGAWPMEIKEVISKN